jgi:putative peptidoglycan lipid II flippase
MTRALWRRGWYRPSAQAVRRLLRIALCAVLMGAAMAALSHLRPVFQPWLLNRKELAVGAAVIAGGVLYALLLPLFRAVTPSEIRAALRRPPKAVKVEVAEF